MPESKSKIVLVILAPVLAWALPLYRSVSFIQEAEAYFRDSHAIDALNDLSYSYQILTAYAAALSLHAGVGSLCLVRGSGASYTVYFLLFALPAWMVFLGPEDPIVIVPQTSPFTPVGYCLWMFLIIIFVGYVLDWGRKQFR